jgi:hypothetical protein
MLLAVSGSAVVASAAILACRRAAVSSKRQADACRRILIDTARVLNVTVAQLGPCLGASVGTIVRWALHGVPSAQRDEVRRLGRRAAALTRCMPADRALHLLVLQHRAADSLADAMRRMRDAEIGRPAAAPSRLMRGVLITSR